MNYASQRVDEFEHILDTQTFNAQNPSCILDHKLVHDDILYFYSDFSNFFN